MALKRVTDTKPLLQICCFNEYAGMGACDEAVGISLGERLLVKILVVVASIQMRTLKTEVGKVSM